MWKSMEVRDFQLLLKKLRNVITITNPEKK